MSQTILCKNSKLKDLKPEKLQLQLRSIFINPYFFFTFVYFISFNLHAFVTLFFSLFCFCKHRFVCVAHVSF